MPLFEAVRLALTQIRVQKLKSFFTLLGVTISVMFLIAVVSIVEGMSRYVEQDFAGKFLGKRKLYPAISPNKTWAGAVGGVVAALAGGFAMQQFRMRGLAVIDVVVLAGVGSVLGQLGDLVESMVKRSRGVKDSGAILPGHGGLLDRLDAVLFIAPWFYLYAMYRAGGMP